MNYRHHPLFWSFGIGNWYGVRLRVSWFFPVVIAALCYEVGPQLGATFGGILFLSVLFHEIGHVVAARALDAGPDEVLMWPLGEFSTADIPSSSRTQILTALGGPVVNLMLCSLVLPFFVSSEYARNAFNPLAIPIPADKFGTDLIPELLVLTFTANWLLLLLNLIPAFPLDCGRVVRSLFINRFDGPMGTEVSIRVAYVAAVILVLVAFFAHHLILLGVAGLLFILAMQESQHMQGGETYEDSFMGYDFSQGYTSLERSEVKKVEPRPGFFQRWRERRRAEKRRRHELQQQEAELKLDALLAKVHEQGMNSLTEAEKRQLKRASDRYRSKDPGQ